MPKWQCAVVETDATILQSTGQWLRVRFMAAPQKQQEERGENERSENEEADEEEGEEAQVWLSHRGERRGFYVFARSF